LAQLTTTTTSGDPMLNKMLTASALAFTWFAVPLEAQRTAPPSIQLTPYAGYAKFGSLISGPLGTSIRNAGAPVYGAELSLGLLPNVAVVGNVAYSQPSLQVGAPFIGGLDVGQSKVLMYDAALRLRAPISTGSLPLTPFIQAGVGGLRQSLSVAGVSTHSTNRAYNLGAGVDIDLSRRLGLQLMAKDYIGKFDAKEATALNLDTRTSHTWALSAGLRLGF
jgi:hypothetical protein